MPGACTREQDGALAGDGSPADGPGLNQVEQMPTQTADLGPKLIFITCSDPLDNENFSCYYLDG